MIVIFCFHSGSQAEIDADIVALFEIDKNGNTRVGGDSPSSTNSSPLRVFTPPLGDGSRTTISCNYATPSNDVNDVVMSEAAINPLYTAAGTGVHSIASSSGSSSSEEKQELSVNPWLKPLNVDGIKEEDVAIESPPKKQKLDYPRQSEVTFFLTGLPKNNTQISREEYGSAISASLAPFHHSMNAMTVVVNQSKTQAKVTLKNSPDNKDVEDLVTEGVTIVFGGQPVQVI